MKLVRIKNKYMYTPKSPEDKKKYTPEGSHMYLVYKDKKTKETRAIQLTHVYEKRKTNLLEKGKIMVEKMPSVKYPSGIRNEYYTKDVSGRPLNLKEVKAINVGKNAVYVNGKKAEKIKKFANKKKH